jgi:hypothetical protein
MKNAVKKPEAAKGRTAQDAPAVTCTGKAASAPAKVSGRAATGAATKNAAPKGGVQANSAPASGAANSAVETRPQPQTPPGKAKLIRGSFSLPKPEYAVLAELKDACLKNGLAVKKNQLLRVGIALLRECDSARLGEMVAALPAVTAKRAKKNK